jgi:hypothetical protein
VGDDIEELVPPSAEELAIYRELRDGPGDAEPAADAGDRADRVPAGPA